MSRRGSWAALAASALLAVLSAAGCGGGVGSGGTGASVERAQGTVSGFGSVIVDGQRFDDRLVAALREDEPGVDRLTETRLGDQVELAVGAGGAATALRVQATLAGAVDSVVAPGRYTVLGQAVQVNADAALGPVTQFGGGYAGPDDVLAGDAVEVHGLLVPQAGASVVRATRIERLAALPAYLQVTGVVGGLSANGFAIGALSVQTATARIVPAGRTLADGQLVTVLAPVTGRSGSAAAPVIVAAQVRIRQLAEAGALVSVGGNIAALDTAAQRFQLGALRVRYAGATLSPPLLALAEGQHVRVRGRLQADGTLQVDSVTLRDGRNEAEAELKGTILGLDGATRRFTVRGVAVDAGGAAVECPGGTLAEGQFVEVEGSLNATGMVAREVHCEDEPTGGTVGRKGVAGSVDVAASRFVLTPDTGTPLTVRWTAATYFEHVTPQTLGGARVQVEGVLENGVLTAKKVEGEE